MWCISPPPAADADVLDQAPEIPGDRISLATATRLDRFANEEGVNVAPMRLHTGSSNPIKVPRPKYVLPLFSKKVTFSVFLLEALTSILPTRSRSRKEQNRPGWSHNPGSKIFRSLRTVTRYRSAAKSMKRSRIDFSQHFP